MRSQGANHTHRWHEYSSDGAAVQTSRCQQLSTIQSLPFVQTRNIQRARKGPYCQGWWRGSEHPTSSICTGEESFQSIVFSLRDRSGALALHSDQIAGKNADS